MLGEIKQTVNVNAYSAIDGENAVYMSAAIRTDGEYSINRTVTNYELYNANKAECKADYSSFEDAVDEIATSVIGE